MFLVKEHPRGFFVAPVHVWRCMCIYWQFLRRVIKRAKARAITESLSGWRWHDNNEARLFVLLTGIISTAGVHLHLSDMCIKENLRGGCVCVCEMGGKQVHSVN